MAIETLSRADTGSNSIIKNPASRIVAFEEAAWELDSLYAQIGVDPLSRETMHLRLINGAEDTAPRTRHAIAHTIETAKLAHEAVENGTVAFTIYKAKGKKAENSAAERARAFCSKADIYKAAPVRASSIPARIR
jgi:hypothetical protein